VGVARFYLKRRDDVDSRFCHSFATAPKMCLRKIHCEAEVRNHSPIRRTVTCVIAVCGHLNIL
jgi:hypothetical protein